MTKFIAEERCKCNHRKSWHYNGRCHAFVMKCKCTEFKLLKKGEINEKRNIC